MGVNMAITINSLISNLYPGRAVVSGQLPVQNQTSPADSGVVFSRDEPWKNQAGNAAAGYSRKDAMGQQLRAQSPSPVDAPPPGQPTELAPDAAESSDTQKKQPSSDSVKKPNGELLSKSEMSLLRELQKADQSVKAHEMAHLAAAGGYAKGGATFSYQRGPDGQNYAVGGEVQVDTGKEATPEATIQKMQIVRQAALAPVDPSPQDQLVAAHATLQISESSKELQLAQAVQSQQPATPAATANDNEGTARGIYQGLGQNLGRGAASASGANPKKNYEAYRNPLPPAVRSDRQGLDRIA